MTGTLESAVSALVHLFRKLELAPESFEAWHAAHARAGEEPWEYDSGPESSERLAGGDGYAPMRDDV